MSGKGRFQAFSHEDFIGWSDLEHTDPPMGTAYGDFRPDGDYASISKRVWAANQSRDLEAMAALALSVRDAAGRVLPAGGGIWLTDYDDPIALREIQLLGFTAFDAFFPQARTEHAARRSR